jgi:hypothetical protein
MITIKDYIRGFVLSILLLVLYVTAWFANNTWLLGF